MWRWCVVGQASYNKRAVQRQRMEAEAFAPPPMCTDAFVPRLRTYPACVGMEVKVRRRGGLALPVARGCFLFLRGVGGGTRALRVADPAVSLPSRRPACRVAGAVGR
jgi:hypothetical protein